jgi:hypothetical protein
MRVCKGKWKGQRVTFLILKAWFGKESLRCYDYLGEMKSGFYDLFQARGGRRRLKEWRRSERLCFSGSSKLLQLRELSVPKHCVLNPNSSSKILPWSCLDSIALKCI